jgi:nucleotide-binding universal stress UspA family protein
LKAVIDDHEEDGMSSNEIIVGVDGAAPSRTALRWASRAAARRGAELVVLLAYHWRIPGAPAVLGPDLEQAAQDQADLIVTDAVAEARAVAPSVAVRGHVVLGDPAPALINAGLDGALIVLGSRGQYGFPAALLGSVSQQVALHARGPVVIVRGKAEPAEGSVVVGFDGSPGADEALRTAFEEASRRDQRLTVVQAITTTLPSWPVSLPPLAYDREAVRLAAQSDLEHTLASWTEKYPEVTVAARAVIGNPSRVLIAASQGAQLIVVGTRGHGGFAGLLLGSVGLHLLHHAECPMLVARPQPTMSKL